MRVLVTGSNGNLGRSVARSLPNIENCISVGRTDWDELDHLFEPNLSAVIHTAYDLKNKLIQNPDLLIKSNILTTAEILKLVKKHNTKRFIFISSCAVYGDNSDTREESVCSPVSFNGLVKLLNEKMIQEFCEKNKLDYVILRVFNMFGGDDNFSVINYLKKSYQDNIPFILNNEGSSQRDFVHVDDVANIIVKIAKSDQIIPKILNIGTGKPTSIKEILSVFEATFGKVSIKKTNQKECEYSRANNKKLLSLFDYNFIDILDYIRTQD